MEQQAFYIIMALAGMVIVVGIVFWAVTYSSRNDYDDYYRNRGGYPPPYYPPNYPPYPPYPPQPRGMSFGDLLSVVLLVVFAFILMQQCERKEPPVQKERLEDDQDQIIVEDGEGGELSYDMGSGYPPGVKSLEPADSYEDAATVNTPPPPPAESVFASFFFQKSASNDRDRILDAAQKLDAMLPGRVFIGVIDDGTGYPYKLLIGPYDSEEAAQSAHGRDIIVYRPVDKGVKLYNPN